ncbi:UNVERIFIED_CONTAM: hypothetical protein GTU68_037413 [Idotea baltica]|nr:hypothetical protein [Idotea baltica]
MTRTACKLAGACCWAESKSPIHTRWSGIVMPTFCCTRSPMRFWELPRWGILASYFPMTTTKTKIVIQQACSSWPPPRSWRTVFKLSIWIASCSLSGRNCLRLNNRSLSGLQKFYPSMQGRSVLKPKPESMLAQ